ncbi:hypothetical protein [Christensenella intestinihominis]|uniref:hypothetical protein n=1 Tax=Christensenella intestinihominis TaxID=1851429 RepID=UPI000836B963|nr:hypothetical protein [Christensenella intestinihominis]
MDHSEKINALQNEIAEEKQAAQEKLGQIDAKRRVTELKEQKKIVKMEEKRDVEIRKATLEGTRARNEARLEQRKREKDAASEYRSNIRRDR